MHTQILHQWRLKGESTQIKLGIKAERIVSLGMVIDGMDPDFVSDVLDAELAVMQERHSLGRSMLTQAGTYAPTLGVLGAVVGLIAALGNLDDINKLGHAVAAAFVATILGSSGRS